MVWLCRLIRVEGDDEVVVIFHIVKRIREKVGKPKRPVWASTVHTLGKRTLAENENSCSSSRLLQSDQRWPEIYQMSITRAWYKQQRLTWLARHQVFPTSSVPVAPSKVVWTGSGHHHVVMRMLMSVTNMNNGRIIDAMEYKTKHRNT